MLDEPAREVVLRYTLRGVLERSPDAPGRALVRTVALQVDRPPRPLQVTVSAHEVLSVACTAQGSSAPEPCGGPVQDAWRVVVEGPGQPHSLQAQVDLG